MPTVFNGTNHQIDQRVQLLDPVTAGTVTITATGLISESVGVPALELLNGAYALTVNGTLSGLSAIGRGLELGAAAFATPLQVSTVTVGATGEITGTAYGITAFHAANIANNGLIEGASGIYAMGGDVAFSIFNTGSIIATAAEAAIWVDGFGTHTITNNGTITGRIEGSFTSDSVEIITNTGTVNGQIWSRGGNDVIDNSGLITDEVFLDGGNDRLTNSGTINGNINGWTGNDIVTNTGVVGGWFFLGEGNDTLRGGASVENVSDEAGNDNYALGDGLDNYDAVGPGSATGTDVVNGGAQTGANPVAGTYGDVFFAGEALLKVTINLDTVARTDAISGLVYAASRADGAETGVDTVRGFETVFTGAGNDVAFGNGLANFISTGLGNDRISGGGGNDYLVGGTGADHLTGGLGRDILDASADANKDTFYYADLAESTWAKPGRDTLYNFAEADRIDLSRLANTMLHYVGTAVAFDGLAGAVIVATTETGWLIQLDDDGDLDADFAIEVVDSSHTGVADWSDNFIF